MLQVETVDVDEGLNGRVEYRLIAGDARGHFVLNPRLGSLHVAAALDREQVTRSNHSALGYVHIYMSLSFCIRVPVNTNVFHLRPFTLIQVLYKYELPANFTRTCNICVGPIFVLPL